MGAFRFDNPFMNAMVRIANLMIVSFYWLVCCLPVVTVIPSCTALYHTTVKVINGSGSGVTRDFFKSFAGAIKQGLLLTLILAASGAVLVVTLNFGRQMWTQNFIWTFYLAIGVFLAFIWLSMAIWIPPVLSRFEAKVSVLVRLALYFASRGLIRVVVMIVLLALVAFLADFYPIALLILPGLYADLIHGGMEKIMTRYMEENGLTEEDEQDEDDGDEIGEAMTSTEFDKLYDDEND